MDVIYCELTIYKDTGEDVDASYKKTFINEVVKIVKANALDVRMNVWVGKEEVKK